MHMADALISPEVGGIMLAATAVAVGYSVKKSKIDLEDNRVPFMGVMGAFVFASQMINFTIPGTGSSGHLAGGLLLAALLGPYAGFITLAAILLIQSLFFGDGGLLAYGCNVFNMGFYACFLAYPFIYKRITKNGLTTKRIFLGSMLSAIVALQMGAFSVVLETLFSGKTELPFGAFVLLMQPIHLAISIVEGAVTAAIITYVWKTRPELLEQNPHNNKESKRSRKRIYATIIVVTLIVAGFVSWFASSHPDGLEWSMGKVLGGNELSVSDNIHSFFAGIQNKIAFLPDYNFKFSGEAGGTNIGTSVSGVLGGVVTFVLACTIGLIIRFYKKRKKKF